MKIRLRPIRALNGQDWLNFGLLAATAIGLFLRVHQYLVRGALWLDEALLANSIVERGARALIFSPLDYNQLAPPGFLQATKAATLLLGPTELALRLPSLVFSLASLVFFALLARKTLRRSEAIYAVIIFAVSFQLLVYSAEVKQYGGDAFASAFTGWLCFKAHESGYSARWLIAAAAAGLSVVWISDPATIILAGSGIGIGLLAWLEKDKRGKRATAFLAPVGLIAGGASLAGSIRRMAGGTGTVMHSSWGTGFMPPPWRSTQDAVWLVPRLNDIYSLVVGVQAHYGLTVLVALFGGWALWKRGRRDAVLIVMTPIAVALIVSAAQLYPLSPGRLTLYLATPLVIALAAGAGEIARRLKAAEPFVMVGLLLAVLSIPEFVRTGKAPPGRREDVRPVLAHIHANYRPGDRIYVYWGAAAATEFYGPRYGLDKSKWTRGGLNGEDWRSYVPQLDALRGVRRVWVVIAHTLQPEPAAGIVRYLDSVGRRWSDNEFVLPPDKDARVILYDLSKSDSAGVSLPR